MVRATPIIEGRALHCGRITRAQVFPRKRGIVFRRADLPDEPTVAADLDHVQAVARRTRLVEGSVCVDTVEHVLSALAGLGVAGGEVRVWGPEVPLLDGSALPWAEAIVDASQHADGAGRGHWVPTQTWDRCEGGRRFELEPAPHPVLDCSIDYDHAVIGRQRVVVALDQPAVYLEGVAPARTFGLLAESETLQSQGLSLGATLASVVVFDEARVLNPGGLRFADEPVRHKALDALGDLALLGAPLRGRVVAACASHAFFVECLRHARDEGVLRYVST